MLLFILLSLLVGSAAAVACIFLGLSGMSRTSVAAALCVLVAVVVVFVCGYVRSSCILCKMNILQELVTQSPESAIKANSSSSPGTLHSCNSC
jgi:hypothetical protein